MRRWCWIGCVSFVLCLQTTVRAGVPSDDALQKPVKAVINSIRYKKDDLAAKQLGFAKMTELVLAARAQDFSDADKKELVAGLEQLVRKVSFQKGRELFEHLDTISYDKPKIDGERAIVKATVVVHKELKKTEVVIDFILMEEQGSWRIVDTVLLGQSTAEGIHEDEIVPLLKQGGAAAVMKALRAKLKELG